MKRLVMFVIVVGMMLVSHIVLSMKYWRSDWSVRLHWWFRGVEVNPNFQGSPGLDISYIKDVSKLKLLRQYPELERLTLSHCPLDMKDIDAFHNLVQLNLGRGELLNYEMLTNHLDILTVECGLGHPIRNHVLQEKFSEDLWNATLLLRPDNVEEVLSCLNPTIYRGLDVDDLNLNYLSDAQIARLREMEFRSIAMCRKDVFWELFDKRRSNQIRPAQKFDSQQLDVNVGLPTKRMSFSWDWSSLCLLTAVVTVFVAYLRKSIALLGAWFFLPLAGVCLRAEMGELTAFCSLQWLGIVVLGLCVMVCVVRGRSLTVGHEILETTAVSSLFAGLEIVVCCLASDGSRDGMYFLLYFVFGVLMSFIGMKWRRMSLSFVGKVLLGVYFLLIPWPGVDVLVMSIFGCRIGAIEWIPFAMACVITLGWALYGLVRGSRIVFNEGVVLFLYLITVRLLSLGFLQTWTFSVLLVICLLKILNSCFVVLHKFSTRLRK